MKLATNSNLSEGNIHDPEINFSRRLKNKQKRSILITNSSNSEAVKALQKSIHDISRKIGEDKINLRILKERQFKKQSEFNKLAGKPVEKTKEQILQDVKLKIQKYKNRQIFDPNYGKKEHTPLPDEETFLVKKNTNRCQLELNFLRDEINKQILSNYLLTNEIKEFRKDKLRLNEKYEKIEEENKEIEKKIILVEAKNKRIYNTIHFKDLKTVKQQGKVMETKFLEQRDYLENRYHKVIEANIRREKDHQNDLKKMRLKNAIFADKARAKGANRSMTTTNINLKLEDEDEIHDRIPILELLVDKWKYITKYKKAMLNKYIKHANYLRISFEELTKFLGINNLSDLPEVIQKEQKQMTDIETYLTGLTTDVEILKEEKNQFEKKNNFIKQL